MRILVFYVINMDGPFTKIITYLVASTKYNVNAYINMCKFSKKNIFVHGWIYIRRFHDALGSNNEIYFSL